MHADFYRASRNVFAAITTKQNAEKVKKWSVLLTAVTAALASVQSTFHIRDNIETFIKANTDMALLEMDYLVQRAPLDDELKKFKEQKQQNGTDWNPDLQKKLIEIRKKFMPRYLDIQADQMRAWGNAGQQSMAPLSDKAVQDKTITPQ